ncbi:hypothetical protein [Novosphingobium acidiphilum]|uniref:hypothetical protein n=1 Tax=Novosphingobium acidiphilum TaxID=505248 RepID=UPI000490F1D5|nr:hypothetical protein [Novosphingobium acidiphilum]
MGLIRTTRGSKVTWRGEPMKVVSTPDFGSITLKSANGEYFHVAVADLEAEAAVQAPAVEEQDIRRQAKVPAYLNALKPLLDDSRNTKADVGVSSGWV